MDCRNGELFNEKDMLKHLSGFEDAVKKDKEVENFLQVQTELTESQVKNKKIGRNDPCVCGSGKKLKNCHWQCKAEYSKRWKAK